MDKMACAYILKYLGNNDGAHSARGFSSSHFNKTWAGARLDPKRLTSPNIFSLTTQEQQNSFQVFKEKTKDRT